MSVFFKDIASDNPVREGDVEKVLAPLGLTTKAEESSEYERLLAANVRLAVEVDQKFGHAWAHRFLIKGSTLGGSMKGKSVCLKDCIAVAGVPQFFGSDAFPAWTPSTDATIVTRVLDEGADILGTATCEHFCNSTSSFTSAQGTVENPHATGYSAGGSTSGGAALVASATVDIALGTDQGGSIRVPASLCGCVGLKPTHGLVPYTGITSGDPIDDHAGPLARCVADVALCLDAIAGYDNIDGKSVGAGPHGTFKFSRTLCGSKRLDGVKVAVLKEGIDHALVQSNRLPGAMGILGRGYGQRGLHLTEFEKARLPWVDSNFQKLFPSTKNTVINGLYLMDKFPGLYSKTVNIGRQLRDAIIYSFSYATMGKKRVLVSYGVDVDAVAGWLGSYGGEDYRTILAEVSLPALSEPGGF
ncbi:Amidase like protein [Verticillium longisporum]|nr:Amidase like protein [Verticillium longisporum]